MIRKVKSVNPIDNYMLEIEFDDSIRILDLKPFLDKPIFNSLINTDEFNKVRVVFNTIEWENGADIDPESLYELSVEIKTQES